MRRLDEGGPARLLAAARGALHIQVGDMVVSVTARWVPLLPNAVRVAAADLRLPGLAPGAPVAVRRGSLSAGALVVSWDPDEPGWDPVAPSATGPQLARALAAVAGRHPPEALEVAEGAAGARGVALLHRALALREPAAAREAADALAGRGPGLTPEGDDLLAAAAVAVRVLGPAGAMGAAEARALAAALLPDDPAARTTPLSATLLRLAGEGAAPEPAARLLAGAGPEEALTDLLRLGGSTGRAWAAGLGAAARALSPA